jgi:benzoate/toluate 1,2-dioxygenase subunit beta
MPADSSAHPGDLLGRCSQFVYEEAELLDRMEFDQWLDLFDEESVYWFPIDTTTSSPLDSLNLIYDDRPRLCDRLARLQSGFAFSEAPASQTSHMLSNLRLVTADEYARSVDDRGLPDGDLALAGRAAIARVRQGTCDVYYARTVWALRPAGVNLKIRMKRIDLLNAQEPLPLLTFLL